jgi:nicotinate-nucleotide adenylyltransferase
VGIFGGAFNPPHVGHLVCAQEAWSQLGLDVVWLVPVGEASHRTLAADPGASVRVALCEEAVDGDPRLEVSRVEVDRDGPSYTSDTLRELSSRGDELILILGADQAASLGGWHKPAEVLALARLAVAAREGVDHDAVLRRLEGLEAADGSGSAADRLDFFDMPRIDVSSSLARERAASGRPIRYLVPERVARAIDQQGLYGATDRAAAR